MPRKTNKTARVLSLLSTGTPADQEDEQQIKPGTSSNIKFEDHLTSPADPLAGLIKETLGKQISEENPLFSQALENSSSENSAPAFLSNDESLAENKEEENKPTASLQQYAASDEVKPGPAPKSEPPEVELIDPVISDEISSASAQIPAGSSEIPSAPAQIPAGSSEISSAPAQIPAVSDEIPSAPAQTSAIENETASAPSPKALIEGGANDPNTGIDESQSTQPIQDTPMAAVPVLDTPVAITPAPAVTPSTMQAPVQMTAPVIPEVDYRYLNMMESLLDDRLLEFMNRFDNCTCDRCKLDVRALAMTNLPPKYVVVPNASIAPLTSYYRNKYNINVITELTKACMEVINHPRHDHE